MHRIDQERFGENFDPTNRVKYVVKLTNRKHFTSALHFSSVRLENSTLSYPGCLGLRPAWIEHTLGRLRKRATNHQSGNNIADYYLETINQTHGQRRREN